MKEIVPPIKSQGIKTKLVTWINDLIKSSDISTDANGNIYNGSEDFGTEAETQDE